MTKGEGIFRLYGGDLNIYFLSTRSRTSDAGWPEYMPQGSRSFVATAFTVSTE